MSTLGAQKEWELHTAREDSPLTTEFISFLETKCKAFELLQNAQVPKTTTASPRSTQYPGAKVSKPSHCNLATQARRSLCNGSHRLFKYDKCLKLQPQQRFSRATLLGVCFICFQPFTKFHICSKQVCPKCNKRNHTAYEYTESSSK
jgi:hypothetical protein